MRTTLLSGTPLTTRAVAALEGIEHLVTQNLDAQALVEELVHRIVRVVEADAYFAAATDPGTGLCLGAGTVYSFSNDTCVPFWEHEFLVPDFNKWADMTPAEPVADLRRATGGRLRLSARYRLLNGLCGTEDEVRVIFHAGGRRWGQLQLSRLAGAARFADADLAFLRRVAGLGGLALRGALLSQPASADPGRGPGVVLLDARGEVVSATAAAGAWLEDLAVGWRKGDFRGAIFPELMTMSLATLDDGNDAGRRVRLRTPSGTWLTAHASALTDAGQVALVIEPAKASEIMPIVVEAYALTPREVDVTQLVARGLSTPEIASTLHLSPHTVRDHLKAIFEKVGVSSRGELTSRLFSDHHHPRLDAAIGESWARTQERMGQLAA